MGFLIGQYEFEGPLVNWRGVKKQPGIYAIMSYANQEFQLVEVAESHDLQLALLDEEKQDYWQRKSLGMLTFSVHYRTLASKRKRIEIVGEILREYDGGCRYFESATKMAVASGSR